jgi:hypothetical protein
MTVDSNVTDQINIEWNKKYGNAGISVINSSASMVEFSYNEYEIVSFNTTDGQQHTCKISMNEVTNKTPNMLDAFGRPAYYSNLTFV